MLPTIPNAVLGAVPSRRIRVNPKVLLAGGFASVKERLYVLALPHRPLITSVLFVVGHVSTGIEELARQSEHLPRVPDYIIALRPLRAARPPLRQLLPLLLSYATPHLWLWSRLAPRLYSL